MRLVKVTWKEYHSVVIKVNKDEHIDLHDLEDEVKDFAFNLDDVMTYKDTPEMSYEEIYATEIDDDEIVEMGEENE